MMSSLPLPVSVFAVLLASSISVPPEVTAPPGWSVTPGNYDLDGSVTAAVFLGATQVGGAGDLLGAFVGEECRGVTEAVETPSQTYIFFLRVYSNQASGEFMTFKFYDSSADSVDHIAESIEFAHNMTVGSVGSPFPLHINHPPYVPSGPSPAHTAEQVPIDQDLGWTGGDPDAGDTLVYQVYFGSDADPPAYGTTPTYPASASAITYDLPDLDLGATYFWKIVAEDKHGLATQGPVWSFTVTTDNAVEPTTWGAIKSMHR
jgi:hypothetical protein